MDNLFTSYESASPPDIVPADAQKVYQESLELIQPTNTDYFTKDIQIDYSLPKDDILEAPEFDIPKETNTSSIQKVIDTARSLIGTNYSWGGSNTNTGFDCSGLLKYVFGSAGIDLPRTAAQQGKIGKQVDISQTQPGDIIWFGSKESPSGQHIGLVSKIENGQIYIIDAAGKKKGVVERPLPNMQIKSVRRLIGDFINTNTNNFQQYALNFFQSKGLPEHMAKGIVGNLLQESNGNPNAVNPKSGAYGIAQWLGSRKDKLFKQYGNTPSIDNQLEYVWQELNTTEKNAFQKLADTTNISDATRAFAHHFERAGKHEMNMNKRIQKAYQV